jgi:hypothetical protein
MEDERIIKVAIGSKIRVTAKVSDGLEGAQWVQRQIELLRLDPRSVEFNHELGTYGHPLAEVWLEGYVSGGTSAGSPSDASGP